MRLLHNTPVDITNEHMGSQSVLFEGTHDVAYICSHVLVSNKDSIIFPERFVDIDFVR